MVLKYKPNNIYNLVIVILITLLIWMLYLGNYNLIEGNSNSTSSEVVNKIDSILENNKTKAKVLQDNISYKTACSSKENMDKKNSDYIREIGGAGNPVSQSVQKANQTVASLCSKNS
jgi:hypothetical protein